MAVLRLAGVDVTLVEVAVAVRDDAAFAVVDRKRLDSHLAAQGVAMRRDRCQEWREIDARAPRQPPRRPEFGGEQARVAVAQLRRCEAGFGRQHLLQQVIGDFWRQEVVDDRVSAMKGGHGVTRVRITPA